MRVILWTLLEKLSFPVRGWPLVGWPYAVCRCIMWNERKRYERRHK